MQATDSVINVSSVPHLSPFRYPGGKTWLIPYVRQWLGAKENKPAVLVEPFCGGGVVSLTSVFEDLVERAVMVEIDSSVAAVWQAMLNGESTWLANAIGSFAMSKETVCDVLAGDSSAIRDIAFRTLLRNRVSMGGILAPGAGLLNKGEAGKGLQSRWYPETIKKRIIAIASKKDRFQFVNVDGISVLREYRRRKTAVFFIDPPYMSPSKRRLYLHNSIDHRRLFETVNSLAGDFLMTYDVTDDALKLAQEFGFETATVVMKGTRNARLEELLIGRDLGWLTEASVAIQE